MRTVPSILPRLGKFTINFEAVYCWPLNLQSISSKTLKILISQWNCMVTYNNSWNSSTCNRQANRSMTIDSKAEIEQEEELPAGICLHFLGLIFSEIPWHFQTRQKYFLQSAKSPAIIISKELESIYHLSHYNIVFVKEAFVLISIKKSKSLVRFNWKYFDFFSVRWFSCFLA